MSVQVFSGSETRWCQMHPRIAIVPRGVPLCFVLVAPFSSPRRSEESAWRFQIQRWVYSLSLTHTPHFVFELCRWRHCFVGIDLFLFLVFTTIESFDFS